MDFSKKKFLCEEARKMDLVKYLSKFGDEPSWRIPSFKVNNHLNLRHDLGLQKGGSLINFRD